MLDTKIKLTKRYFNWKFNKINVFNLIDIVVYIISIQVNKNIRFSPHFS